LVSLAPRRLLLRRSLVVPCALCALLMACALASSASASGATVVVTPRQCTPFGDLGTNCFSDVAVSKLTTTPSGNLGLVINQRLTTSFTGAGAFAGCTSADVIAEQSHLLVLDGTNQVATITTLFKDNVDCNGVIIDVCVRSHVVAANDQVLVRLEDVPCQPV
jgi:hypothetical protein